MEKFNLSDWRLNQKLKELEDSDSDSDSIFKIDPKLAHKIWELINGKLEENIIGSNNDFVEEFPTASGFFHFLNKNLNESKK